MKIDRIRIGAFRSLYDVELAPGELTVLVGANNAGKTNFADALDFLSEAHRHGLEMAVRRKGGFENIAFRRKRRTRRPISFEIEATLAYADIPLYVAEGARTRIRLRRPPGFNPGLHVRHAFEIKAESESIRADFAVVREAFELSYEIKGTWRPLMAVRRENGKVTFEGRRRRVLQDPQWRRVVEPFFESGFDSFVGRQVSPTDLAFTSLVFNQVARALQTALAEFHVYQLVPLECRRPGAPTPNAELERHGNNLPAHVAFMQENDRRAWDRTLSTMREIIPDLDDIRTIITPERTLALEFAEEGVGRPWAAHEVSDGTIQALALFSAVFDSRYPFLLVEEPENSVHPWIVRVFADACREAGKQILVTTHSPALLSYLRPEEVTVVWRREGRTYLSPLPELGPEVQELWASGASDVFELLDSGVFRETVPQGYA